MHHDPQYKFHSRSLHFYTPVKGRSQFDTIPLTLETVSSNQMAKSFRQPEYDWSKLRSNQRSIMNNRTVGTNWNGLIRGTDLSTHFCWYGAWSGTRYENNPYRYGFWYGFTMLKNLEFEYDHKNRIFIYSWKKWKKDFSASSVNFNSPGTIVHLIDNSKFERRNKCFCVCPTSKKTKS